MALGDLFKKAVDKGLSAVGDAIEKGKQLAEEQGLIQKPKTPEELEAERIAAEQKLQEENAAEELRKQKELERILKPSCEKGDCLWYKHKFYFTCPVDCPCERKTYTKKDWGKEIIYSEFWPYMKRLEKRDDNIPNHEQICKDFMTEFLPQYGEGQWGLADDFIWCGLTAESPLLPILFAIKDMPTQEQMNQKINYLRNHYTVLDTYVLKDPFCKNVSLYSRPFKDFEYTVKIFALVLNDKKLSEYFKDISGISIEQLYDSAGNIKPAGCGGPEKGHYGDTIWNTVESWSGENGENDK